MVKPARVGAEETLHLDAFHLLLMFLKLFPGVRLGWRNIGKHNRV
jgi:hypothetical protein